MTTQFEPQQTARAGQDRPTPPIAFLGTGRMGGPMAANLARAGFEVRAWNRTADRAEALAEDGAIPAASPAHAVDGAGILITMLADGPATEQVWRELADLIRGTAPPATPPPWSRTARPWRPARPKRSGAPGS